MSSNVVTSKPTGNEALEILERLQTGGHVSEALVQEQLAAVRGGIHGDTHTRVEGAAQVQGKRELEPAQIEQLVATLKANFTANGKEFPKLHQSVQWTEVEASLRAQPEVMWSLSKMEETGGKVDVTGEDDNSFLFEDTSKESPADRRNVVYDVAEKTAEQWGVDLEDPEQYRALQDKIPLDSNTWSWLKTPPHTRKAGYALNGSRFGADVCVLQSDAYFHSVYGGFRCALRVLKKS